MENDNFQKGKTERGLTCKGKMKTYSSGKEKPGNDNAENTTLNKDESEKGHIWNDKTKKCNSEKGKPEQ